MSFTVTTAPTVYPVTIEEVLTHLRITVHDFDAELFRLIKTATRIAEDDLGRALMTQTLTYYRNCFPASEFYLPRPRVQSISEVKYYDPDGVLQTLTANDYEADIVTEPAVIRPAYGHSWPSTRTIWNAVSVKYVTGYGSTQASVPEHIRQAILLLIGSLWSNRSATSALGQKAPEMRNDDLAYQSLISRDRIFWLADDEDENP